MMKRTQAQRSRPGRHCRGAFAVMAAPLLILIVALTGLALDTGMLYNRKVELSGMARAAALAAARKLDGTAAGIAAARSAARDSAEGFIYAYDAEVAWNDAALQFGTSAARDGTWTGAAGVANPADYHYVKVDTAGLDADLGLVTTLFMPIFSAGLRTISIGDSAIAGRSAIKAVPLAVCAMSEAPALPLKHIDMNTTELVQYGFRRGVSYDLMQLNPTGTTPARFMVNPVVPPGTTGSSLNPAILGPFVCSGTLWMPHLGGQIRVSPLPASAPLGALAAQLNARFDDYGGKLCHLAGAPPDTNVMPFAYDKAGGVPWMTPATGKPSATSTTERGWLETVADIPPPGSALAGLDGGSYGPLWSYAKAAKFASWSAGVAEPASGYDTFGIADWSRLYRSDVKAISYPASSGTPYAPLLSATPPPTVLQPDEAHRDYATANRRVLYLPLLACNAGLPAGANSAATVAAIGKFFMTVPATSESLVAEFAGIAAPQSIAAYVELYP